MNQKKAEKTGSCEASGVIQKRIGRDHGICCTGCLSSPDTQHTTAALVQGVKKEIGRLRELSHIWCPEEDL